METPVSTPAFGWTSDGVPVVGGGSGYSLTVNGAVVTSGTSQVGAVIAAAGTATSVNEITISLLPGSMAAMGMIVVIGAFVIIRWVIKSIPFV